MGWDDGEILQITVTVVKQPLGAVHGVILVDIHAGNNTPAISFRDVCCHNKISLHNLAEAVSASVVKCRLSYILQKDYDKEVSKSIGNHTEKESGFLCVSFPLYYNVDFVMKNTENGVF